MNKQMIYFGIDVENETIRITSLWKLSTKLLNRTQYNIWRIICDEWISRYRITMGFNYQISLPDKHVRHLAPTYYSFFYLFSTKNSQDITKETVYGLVQGINFVQIVTLQNQLVCKLPSSHTTSNELEKI